MDGGTRKYELVEFFFSLSFSFRGGVHASIVPYLLSSEVLPQFWRSVPCFWFVLSEFLLV